MRLVDRTVLITGGSEGVGLELARALLPRNTVIICARSASKLNRARAELPGIHAVACDVTDPDQRRALAAHVVAAYPNLDVLINNAGARILVDLIADPLSTLEQALGRELALNFVAPAAMCAELLGQLRARPRAAIVNVTTGLVHLPKAAQPFYCAAKAALHSYTRSLRWALRGSPVSVHEVLLPVLATNFHAGGLSNTSAAMSAPKAARAIIRALARDRSEIYVGKAGLARWFDFWAPRLGLSIINR